MQPVLTVRHGHLAYRGLDPAIRRGEQHGVAAAGPAGAEDADGVGHHIVAGGQVGDGVDEVLQLPARREESTVACGIAEAAVVEDQYAESCRGEGLVVADVELRILQAQPAWSLHDGAERAGPVVRRAPQRGDSLPFAVEGDGGAAHAVGSPS